MVQPAVRGRIRHYAHLVTGLCLGVLLASPMQGASRKLAPEPPDVAPQLELPDGRKLTYEGSFETERDARGKKGFWKKLADVITGEGPAHGLVRPYSIVTESLGRVIVSDPGASGVHIFDFQKRTYKFLTRDHGTDKLESPQCVAVDAENNIYVTDSTSGKIFVFEADGKFRRVLGSLPGGEGFFKRPTGIAVDSSANTIYVTDTTRHKIFVLDMEGRIERTIGQNGTAAGEFNYPTELHLVGKDLLVVDAMNFRLQRFDNAGAVKSTFGEVGDGSANMFRPKGVGIDSEGHYYVADAFHNTVQVFDAEGQMLYAFGSKGTGAAQFQIPAGLTVDNNNRIFVVDSFNHRVQVFHYFGHRSAGAQ
jgi:DNA-binding beta-propeller fold protein YncE